MELDRGRITLSDTKSIPFKTNSSHFPLLRIAPKMSCQHGWKEYHLSWADTSSWHNKTNKYYNFIKAQQFTTRTASAKCWGAKIDDLENGQVDWPTSRWDGQTVLRVFGWVGLGCVGSPKSGNICPSLAYHRLIMLTFLPQFNGH